MNWFVRWGVFYRPVSLTGWLLLAAAVAYIIWAFADIDSRSHSASDTLINWFFNILLVGLAYSVIGYLTEKRYLVLSGIRLGFSNVMLYFCTRFMQKFFLLFTSI